MKEEETLSSRIKRFLFGPPRNIRDTSLFHKISLIPLLAWIGLGSDGLSSSSYGPQEAFLALGEHKYLAIFIAVATTLTIAIISYSYTKIIEHFPYGGGGYVVATHTLGKHWGVISGSALLIDYIMTIAVSIASCGDALFSFIPLELHHFKIPFEIAIIIFLMVLNIRGLKESIVALTPIFLIFIVTHTFMILYSIFAHISDVSVVIDSVKVQLKSDVANIGFAGVLSIFLKAFSMGAGTYTGIEAVSNGLLTLREPRVENGKKTMLYMAVSLAFTASGLLLCYLLIGVDYKEGMTLNAVVANSVFNKFWLGSFIALITILSEGALLIVAAQTGFVDGPRVMANMAVDSWLPHKFSALSERLTLRNGILIMGISAILVLFYTHGNISMLVVMYSINVFITFTLSIFGITLYMYKHREKNWQFNVLTGIIGTIFCVTILIIAIYEKFTHGGWLTMLITGSLVGLCYLIKKHYDTVGYYIKKVSERHVKLIEEVDKITEHPNRELDKSGPVAVQLVGGFSGFGIETFLSILENFPGVFRSFIFVSVGVIDSGNFKGVKEIARLEGSTKASLLKYIRLANKYGYPADYRYAIGIDVVEEATNICAELSKEFHHITVFAGQLTFDIEKFYHGILHNQTAFAIQRRLQAHGIPMVIMPIKIDENK